MQLCSPEDILRLINLQKVTGYLPKDDGMKQAFKDADIVVIPAGIPRKYIEIHHYKLARRIR